MSDPRCLHCQIWDAIGGTAAGEPLPASLILQALAGCAADVIANAPADQRMDAARIFADLVAEALAVRRQERRTH